MFLNHVALVCSSEEKSDRFYKDVLDLEKLQSKVISSDLSKKIFNLDNEYRVIDYGDENIRFEIFISERSDFAEKRVSHVCLNIKGMSLFLQRCAENQVDIIKIPKGDNILVFIKDYDENMFEIKESI
jgi:catechol 2,3-dioxygenase-like lactoylglutathione lyase family enzyme